MNKTKAFSEETVKDIVSRNNEPEWLEELRLKAWKLFQKTPMPSEKHEDWRYTNVEKLDLNKFHFSQAGMINSNVNGAVVMDMRKAVHEYQDIVKNHFMKAIKFDADKFSLMHTAFWDGGVFVYVPGNKEIAETVKIAFQDNAFNHSMIIVENGSRLKFFEECSAKSAQESINSGFAEIFAKEGSNVDFCTIQNLGQNVYDFSVKNVIAERYSRSNFIFGSFGGKLTRLKNEVMFNGQGAECEVLGVFSGDDAQHNDITTNSFHNVPNTTNNISVKGVLRGKASSIYRGLIRIEKPAQKTNSYLSDHTLKLSEQSVANSIPSLQIEANDVKASHGATVGQVDENQIFYLMSRGLGRQEAERLIVTGFFQPVVDRIRDEDIKTRVKEIIKI